MSLDSSAAFYDLLIINPSNTFQFSYTIIFLKVSSLIQVRVFQFSGTVTKRSQLSSVSSASNSFACEDDLALYDEYLLSELMLANVKKNCQDGKDQGNQKSIYYVLGLFLREIYLSVKTVDFIQVFTNHNLPPLYKTVN